MEMEMMSSHGDERWFVTRLMEAMVEKIWTIVDTGPKTIGDVALLLAWLYMGGVLMLALRGLGRGLMP